jgi:putative ABC transport system permease protein
MNLLWRMSLRNLFRNTRRSLTTGIAIAAGFVGLSLLGGYILRAQKGLETNTVYINLQGHLQIRKTDSMDKFSLTPKKYLINPESDSELVKVLDKHNDDIEFYGKFLTGSGLLVAEKVSQPFLARGYQAEILFKALHHPAVERWAKGWASVRSTLVTEQELSTPGLISITPVMAEIIGRPKDLKNMNQQQKDVQLITRTYTNDLNAVNAELGLLHTTGIALAEDTSLRMPLLLLQDLLATDGYQYMSLFLKSGDRADSLKQSLQKEFTVLNLPLQVFHFTEGEAGEFYVGTMNFLYVMGAFFIFLICGMVSLSIVNSLTLGILERAKEIGTLKALGFSTVQIVNLFVRETIWLCGLSIASGLVLSQVITIFVNSANIRFSPPGVEGDIQFQLAPNFLLFFALGLLLMSIALLTSYAVSKTKLKSSAIQLLSEAGV